jgi:zinc transport system permease protein
MAVTVVLGMKVVGIIFVSALVAIPAAAALQISGSFKSALLLSAVLALVSVVVGLLLAFLLDIPASATIVLLSFLFFCVCFVVRHIRRLS